MPDRIEPRGRQAYRGKVEQQSRDGPEVFGAAFGQPIAVDGIVRCEASRLGATESHEVTSESELLPQIPRQRAYVGAGRASDLHVDLVAPDLEDVEGMDMDSRGRASRDGSLAGELIEAPALHPLGRVGGRHLFQVSRELTGRGNENLAFQVNKTRRPQGSTLQVIRCRREAETDGGAVDLFTFGQEACKPGRLSDADHEDAAREGIEGPGVPDAPLA